MTSFLVASLLASTVLLAFKTISLKSAFSSINGRTLLAIVTTVGVGTAFETTGLAHLIARGQIGILIILGLLVQCYLLRKPKTKGVTVPNIIYIIFKYPVRVICIRLV